MPLNYYFTHNIPFLYTFRLSWGVLYAAILLIVTLIVTSLMVGIRFYENSNFLLVFLLMYLYGMSIVCLSFVFTPFFSKARVTIQILLSNAINYIKIYSEHHNYSFFIQTAGALASFTTVILSMLYLPVSLTRESGPSGPESTIPMGGQWALSLFSPVAFALGIDRVNITNLI